MAAVLGARTTQGSRIMTESKLKSSRSLTVSSPVNSMSGLVLWLDATDSTTISTGTVASNAYTNAPNNNADVVYWMDRNPQISTAKKELTAPLDANRPKYIKNGIVGLPTLQFDGSTDYLQNNLGVIASGKTNYTMVAVFQSTIRSQRLIFGQSSTCSGANLGILLGGSTVLSRGCGGGYDYGVIPYQINTPYVAIVRVNKGQANINSIYVNGATDFGSPASIGVMQSGAITVGGYAGGSGGFFNGYISEIIVFDRALTNAEVVAVQSYLSGKYSIKI